MLEKLAVSLGCAGLMMTISPVLAEAGKAVPSVTISTCQISQSGGIGGGVVSASGSWSGLRAGAIVSATVIVTQSADAGAFRRAYRGTRTMTLTSLTRTSGSLAATEAAIEGYEGFPSWLEAGYAYGQITLNLPRGGAVSSESISCTVVA